MPTFAHKIRWHPTPKPVTFFQQAGVTDCLVCTSMLAASGQKESRDHQRSQDL